MPVTPPSGSSIAGPVPAGQVDFTVAFDHSERLAAEWVALRHAPVLRRPAVQLALAVVGAPLITAGLVLIHHAIHPALPGFVAPAASVVLAGYVLLRRLRGRAARKHRQENPDHGSLSDAGFEISAVDDLTLLSWSSMTWVGETERFFLFVAGAEVQYIPKHALTAGQIEAVRGLSLRHAPPAALSAEKRTRLIGPPGSRPWARGGSVSGGR